MLKGSKIVVRYFVWLIVMLSFVMTAASAHGKYADLAGSWYSDSQEELKLQIEKYLKDARVAKIEGDIIGVISPHAGLQYSGAIAAYSYKALMGRPIETAIVIGFSHKRYLPGRIAVLAEEGFSTPLQRSIIDQELTAKLIAYDKNIQNLPEIFSSENSVELEIPFVQTVLKDAKLVLIALCDQSQETCQLLGSALTSILQDKKNFVLIASTDMSHYMTYQSANKRDAQTIEAISKFDPDMLYETSLKNSHELMCGISAVYSTMIACKKLGADEVKVLKYANSGDTRGMKDRVVGYLSAVFVRPQGGGGKNMLNENERQELLKIARDTITHYLKTGKRFDVKTEDGVLKQPMGAFVTLHKHGELRGCIGHMVAQEPLYLTIRDMAIAAATEDPRFPPVSLNELEDIDIEISALSPMKRITDYNTIEMGKHGVMVKQHWQSGVYLPQVATETGWSREEFLTSLCAHKAGISPNAWKTGECEIYVFTAEVFGEKHESR